MFQELSLLHWQG